MGSIIGRAKRLRREGFPAQDFKEIKLAGGESLNLPRFDGHQNLW